MKQTEIIFLSFLLLVNLNSFGFTRLRTTKSRETIRLSEKYLTFDLSPHQVYNYENSFVSLAKGIKRDTGHIIQNLTRKMNEYSGKVKIGNPPQDFEMVFDTGSANFIIVSSKCNSNACNAHKKYNANNSNTAKKIISIKEYNEDYVPKKEGGRDTVQIRFGTGNVKCLMTEDNACLGEGSKFCINNLLILESIYESEIPFSSVKFDGIIGLSFSHLSVNKQSNFIDQLAEQNIISQKVFSFYFNHNDNLHSQIHIGGINNAKFSGNIHFAKVISNSYWEIKIDNIYYGDIKLDFCNEIICTAVVDTGTSMLAAPSHLMQAFYHFSMINDDCSNFETLKHFKFEINGILLNLDPDFYIIKLVNDQKASNLPSEQEIQCLNAFMTIDALSSPEKLTLILGSPFLKKYYTVFDRENLKIGFALAKHE